MGYEQFAAVYDGLMRDVPYDDWAAFILTKTGVKAGEPALDAACGTGSITIRLAKKGLRVIGADSSEQMLQKAAQRARAAAVQVPFVLQKLQQTQAPHPLRLVCCVCDGVNYVSPRDASVFFARAYKALMPGGWLVFDVSSQYKLKKVLGNNIFYEDKQQLSYYWRNQLTSSSVKQELTFFLRREDGLYERFDEHNKQYIHTQPELELGLSAAGFNRVTVYDGYTDAPPTPQSRRLVFAACKD